MTITLNPQDMDSPFLETKKLRLKRWQMLFTKLGCFLFTCLKAHSVPYSTEPRTLGLRESILKVYSVELRLKK